VMGAGVWIVGCTIVVLKCDVCVCEREKECVCVSVCVYVHVCRIFRARKSFKLLGLLRPPNYLEQTKSMIENDICVAEQLYLSLHKCFCV
jgi:hypothetical protein